MYNKTFFSKIPMGVKLISGVEHVHASNVIVGSILHRFLQGIQDNYEGVPVQHDPTLLFLS